VLAQCALFVGRFSRAAVQAVTGATVSDLASLVDKALIQQPGVGIYQLHDLLRQFAHQQLAALDAHEQAELQARYVAYYLGFVAACNLPLRQAGAQTTVLQLRQASENCRRAWEIALEQRWVAPISAALDGWLRYWEITGSYHEGEALVAGALALVEPGARETTAPRLARKLLAKLWLAYARCLQGQERIKGCLVAAEKASALALACDEAACYAQAEALYATGLCLELRHAEARPYAERALQSGVWEAQIEALITLASYETSVDAHVTITAQALQIAKQNADPYLILQCTQEMAGSYENEGYYAHSLPYRGQALTLAYEIQDPYHIGEAHYLYGLIHAHLGLYPAAIEHFTRALAIAREHSVIWLERRTLNRLAHSHFLLGQLDLAHAFALQVQSLRREGDDLPSFFDFVYAQILAARGQWGESERVYQEIVHRKRTDKGLAPAALLPELAELARLALWQGKQEQALHYVEKCLAIMHAHSLTFTPILYFNAYAVDLACYEVLHALGDERATIVLTEGHQRLWAQVEQIADPTVRRSYLENVAANRLLHEAYRCARQLTSSQQQC
jgi:tetratricopeptide (TPR) repeat protein